MGRIVSVGRMVEEKVELSTEASVDMGMVDMVDMGRVVVGMNGATGVPITEPG